MSKEHRCLVKRHGGRVHDKWTVIESTDDEQHARQLFAARKKQCHGALQLLVDGKVVEQTFAPRPYGNQ